MGVAVAEEGGDLVSCDAILRLRLLSIDHTVVDRWRSCPRQGLSLIVHLRLHD